MPKYRSWTDEQLIEAVKNSYSYREVIKTIGLVPAGGNYAQVTRRIEELGLDTSHFKGKGWNVGWKFDPRKPKIPLSKLLVNGRETQSHKLRIRLIEEGLKLPECELCGWCKVSDDGRLPLELDHINGDRLDNRIQNLRIICPNCHSLQPTHRGKNKKVRLKYS
jgi:hypothetical protein